MKEVSLEDLEKALPVQFMSKSWRMYRLEERESDAGEYCLAYLRNYDNRRYPWTFMFMENSNWESTGREAKMHKLLYKKWIIWQ